MKFRDTDRKDSALARSLFLQEICKCGVLSLGTHKMCAAHDCPAVEHTLQAYAAAVKTLAQWLQDPERFLEGAIIQPVFRTRG